MTVPAPLNAPHTDVSSPATMRAAGVPVSWRARFRKAIALVRRIVGVPDYDTYLAYMQRQHPECTPMDARAFERERLADKYARPGSRCC